MAVSQDELIRRFIAARQALGISQDEAARRLGVSGGTVSRWERGKQTIKKRDVDAIERLASESAEDPDETVPRGTSDGQRMAWERVVNTERAQDWLDDFRARLRKLGVGQDERDSAVRSVRRVGLVDSTGGVFHDWTEDEAIQAMENAAKPILDMFADLKRAR